MEAHLLNLKTFVLKKICEFIDKHNEEPYYPSYDNIERVANNIIALLTLEKIYVMQSLASMVI